MFVRFAFCNLEAHVGMGQAGTERRPVVEFAIENAQTLKKREIRRRSINTEDARGPKGASSAEAAADGAEPAEGAEQAASKRKPRKRKREEKSAAQVRATVKTSFPPWYPLHPCLSCFLDKTYSDSCMCIDAVASPGGPCRIGVHAQDLI